MIDTHVHLLPGIDDGPKDMAEAVAMAQTMVSAGITKAAVTPHCRLDFEWDNQRQHIVTVLGRLQQQLSDDGVDLELFAGAEHFYDDLLISRVEAETATPINLKRHILVELSTSSLIPNLPQRLFDLRRRGLEPILAHVERYPSLLAQEDMVCSLLEQQYLFQVDAGALCGAFGFFQKRIAWRLVNENRVAIVASDGHSAEDIRQTVAKTCKMLHKKVGESRANKMLIDNPAAIIDGRSLDDPL